MPRQQMFCRVFETELKRFPKDANRRAWRALEIGCGPGRLMKPLSRHFGEIHGVDVSDEMIRLARERLADIPHAHVHATNGASLAQFADESFDFVYSYAVFQHIPSRDVVLEYMREIRRVLKPGGFFRGQFNGLPHSGDIRHLERRRVFGAGHPNFYARVRLATSGSGGRAHPIHVDHLGPNRAAGANRTAGGGGASLDSSDHQCMLVGAGHSATAGVTPRSRCGRRICRRLAI